MNAHVASNSRPANVDQAPRQVDYSDIRFADPIFDSVRVDYPDLDEWIRSCIQGTAVRYGFVFETRHSEYDGIAIVKVGEAADGPNPAGMKISTFKVASHAEGSGLGDQLLEAVLQLAIRSEIEQIFITVPPKHEDLVRFLERAGFRRHPSAKAAGDLVYTADLTNFEGIYSHLNRLAYEMLASEYDERSQRPGPNQERPDSLARMLVGRILGPVRRVLELGPGSGSVLNELSRISEHSVAVEISPAMATIAAGRAPKSTVIVADALDIDFPRHHFDGVFAGAFLHLFPKPEAQRMLRKMAYWTRPGGAILVNTSIAQTSGEGLEDKLDYIHRVARFRSRWTEDEFVEMIESSGLEIVGREVTDERERQKYWLALICRPLHSGTGI